MAAQTPGSCRLVGRSSELRELIVFVEEGLRRGRLSALYGPRGSGKTCLTTLLRGLLPYRYRVVELGLRYPLTPRSLGEVVAAGLREVLGERHREELLRRIVPSFSRVTELLHGRLAEDPWHVLAGLLARAAAAAAEQGYQLLVVVDPLDNLAPGLGNRYQGLLELLSDIVSEAQGHLGILFTASTQAYTRLALSHPGLVQGFYLGEMTREDAGELASTLGAEEEALETLGGIPGLLVRARTSREAQAVVEAAKTGVALALAELGEEAGKARKTLENLADQPLPLHRLPAEKQPARKLVGKLVKRGLLQYACSRRLGIYNWNQEKGGEPYCPPDTVAPASRPVLRAIQQLAAT